MSAEPLTPDAFEKLRSLKLITGLNAYAGHFDTDAERELYVEAVKHHNARIVLAAEVARLNARVAELEAATETVWRADCWDLTGGHYRTRAAAEDHCERFARRDPSLDGFRFRWIMHGPDPSDEDPSYLYAVRGLDEFDTGYNVTPLTVQAAYDPDGDE